MNRDISVKQEEPEDHPHLNILHMVVCKDEKSPPEQERTSSLLKEEPEPTHIKEEQEELLHRPEEPDGSMLTLLAVKRKADNDEDISSHCYEIEVELESETEDHDDWERASGGQSVLNSGTGKIGRSGMTSQAQYFSCPECPASYTTQLSLHKHIGNLHHDLYCQMLKNGQIMLRNGQITSASRQEITSSTTSQEQGVAEELRSYSHQQFAKTLTRPGELKAYLDFLNYTGMKANPNAHTCKQCGKDFKYDRDLKLHQRVHTG